MTRRRAGQLGRATRRVRPRLPFSPMAKLIIVPPVPGRALVPFQSSAPHRHLEDRALEVDVILSRAAWHLRRRWNRAGPAGLAGIAYVGAGVLGSSAGMDKDVMKRLFREAGLPIVKQVTVLRQEWEASPRKVRRRIESELRYPLFIKPANLGSSVGISKVHGADELPAALNEAAAYDRKIVVERVWRKIGQGSRTGVLGTRQ